MIAALLLSKAGVIALTFLGVFMLERTFPATALRSGLARLGRNFSLVTLNIILSPFIVIPITKLASNWALAWRPEWLGGWFGLGIDVLVLDCWIYFWHRLNHVVPFLWRFHEVHHLDENLDASSALRFHFGEVALSAVARVAIIYGLTISFAHVVIFETLVTVAALFHHSNLRLALWFERLLSLIIVTPSIHWVHHHALRSDTDSNYATVFSVWDIVFKSRSPNMRIAAMKMGVEGKTDVNILRLILRPFYRA